MATTILCRAGLLALVLAAGGAGAQGRSEVPAAPQRRAAVRSTIRDYDARLRARFSERLGAWQRGFLERRRARLDDQAARLARLASRIRDRRQASWPSVGQDREFVAGAREVVAELLQAAEIRGELAEWAGQVERETRLEMLRCFQQIIAWDLGLHFDQRLRGKVEQAVRAIPVEELVAEDTSREELVEAIQAGLPGVILTDRQRASIAAAAGELARRGAQWLTVSQLQLPPDWAELLSGLAAMGAAWAADQGLEWIDRSLTGEPHPAEIAAGLGEALADWNRRTLGARLGGILRAYRVQVLQFVQAEGEAAARAGGIETGP